MTLNWLAAAEYLRSPLSRHGMLLTKHEGITFQNQTIYISGQAFIRCTFMACTLVLRETVYYLEGCTFDRCNWHVDRVLMWGSPESVQEVKALVQLIESVQQQQAAAGRDATAGAAVASSPFVSANSSDTAAQPT
jgi:hypothetical protein